MLRWSSARPAAAPTWWLVAYAELPGDRSDRSERGDRLEATGRRDHRHRRGDHHNHGWPDDRGYERAT